jgi:hypothetical protein
MVISSITFYALTYDAVNLRFTTIAQLDSLSAAKFGLINVELANNRVIKDLSMLEISREFDKNIGATNDSTIEMETSIVIPPLLNYVTELRIPYTAALSGYTHIRCIINGAAGIIAPRTTF